VLELRAHIAVRADRPYLSGRIQVFRSTLRRLLRADFLLGIIGVALLIDSNVRMRPSHPARGIDPFVIADKPLEAAEWYLGWICIGIGIWMFRQSRTVR
jgi:hypothetical protein